jgi:tetratricopeptide (TPR) repeat protein
MTEAPILEQDPTNLYALLYLARTYMDKRDLATARSAMEEVRPKDRHSYQNRLFLALLLALEGKREEGLKELDDDLLKYAAAVITLTSYVVDFYALIGDDSKALEWLDRAVRNGDERAAYFLRDPNLAGIRNHPRFKQILDSIAFRRQRNR